MRWTRALTIIGLLVALAIIVGAFVPVFVGRAEPSDSLGNAVRASVGQCSTFGMVRDFKIVSRRETERGTLASYTASCLSLTGRNAIYGYAVVRPGEDGKGVWRKAVAPSPEGLSDYAENVVCAVRGCSVYVWGRVIPKVRAVEAVFDGGQVDRVEPTNGIFVLTAPGTDDACELRMLDAAGAVLEKHALTDLGECSP